MPRIAPPPSPEWDALSPHVDAALARLSDLDRAAIIAHCIHQQPVAEVAAVLQLSAPAAHKRIQRALARLRGYLTGRASPASAAALPALLATHALTSAPAHLSPAIATAAFSCTTGTAFTLAKGALHMLFWSKAKLALATTVTVVALATTIPIVQHTLAQSAPAPATAPAATTPAAPAHPPLVATLPSGTKVEILAIGRYGILDVTNPQAPPSSRWWHPDGAEYPEFTFDPNRRPEAKLEFLDTPHLVAFRITNTNDPAIAATARVSTSNVALLSAVPTTSAADSIFAIDILPDPGKPATVRFELATGEWKSRANRSAAKIPMSSTHHLPNNQLITLALNEGPRNTLVASVVDSLTHDAARLMLIPKTEGKPATNPSDENVRQIAAILAGTQSMVARATDAPFRTMDLETRAGSWQTVDFATRPYNEFVEFTGLPMDPAPSAKPLFHSGTLQTIKPAQLPADDPAEYYVTGEVERPGVYTLTGRQITIKQALAAARHDLKTPATLTLTRRTSRFTEARSTLDLAAILAGTAPDLFLQPNDILTLAKPSPK